jgi:hypothetical protein
MQRRKVLGAAIWCSLACCAPGAWSADVPASGPLKWEPDIQKFEAADRARPPAPGQIVFVGSSSIRKWDLRKSFPQLCTINRGFGGSELSDSVYFFERIVAPYRPRQIVLYAGDNDIGKKKAPEKVAADFHDFVAKAHAQLPGVPVVYIGIKPSLKRWGLVEQVRAANALIRAECESDPLLTFIDVEPAFLGSDGKPRPELFVGDGLHLTEQGYALWSGLLAPVLKR